jgi:hypothetical protein
MSDASVQIVSGPIPDEFGNANFVVQIGDRRIEAVVDACGAGVGEPDFDVSGPVLRAVSDFRQHSPLRTLACLREAATLRRAAGHAGPLDVQVPGYLKVEPLPAVRENAVVFTVQGRSSAFRVLVTRDGAIVDDHDPMRHPDGEVGPEVLAGCRRAVLDFVLANRDGATALGLDCELLDLLWR